MIPLEAGGRVEISLAFVFFKPLDDKTGLSYSWAVRMAFRVKDLKMLVCLLISEIKQLKWLKWYISKFSISNRGKTTIDQCLWMIEIMKVYFLVSDSIKICNVS